MKTKFKQLLKEREKLLEQQAAIFSRLSVINYDINKTCECKEREPRSSYSYGGYDHQGEDRTWEECVHCGKTYNLKIRLTGFG